MNQNNSNEAFEQNIAECVGLWLAEGDDKCSNEITFTNNELALIELFNDTIRKLFRQHIFNVRVYIYSQKEQDVRLPFTVTKINRYVDVRATKPYFIWRLASVTIHKKWKELVQYYKDNPRYYEDILRGFFAGEGSVKSTSHGSRSLVISQNPCSFLEVLLKHRGIGYHYRPQNRSYTVTHYDNWKKFAEARLADLHPGKKEKFWKIYSEFKQMHYRKGYLKASVENILTQPCLPEELAEMFSRTKARIQDILIELKKEDKIENYKVRSKCYWIQKTENTIIISDIKKKYLKKIGKNAESTTELAKYFNVNFKSSFNRLKELEKLGLVERREDKKWQKIETDKRIIVI